MTIKVFIDASKLIQFGHGLDNAEARKLVELCEVDVVEMITTDLTVAEVAKRFTKTELEKLQDIFKADFRDRATRYLGLELPVIDRDSVRQNIFKQQLGRVNDFIGATKARLLSIDDVKPSEVLGDYTHGLGLFSGASKKDQFPDAFILATLLRSLSDGQRLVIHAQDKDFGPAVKSLPNVCLVDTFEGLLRELGISMVDDSTFDFIAERSVAFSRKVGSALSEYIVHADDVEDGEMEVNDVSDVELDISHIYGAGENKFLVYASVSCKAEVDFSHPDWDSAIYDSEDKVLIPFESVSGSKQVDLEGIAFSFEVEVDEATSSVNVTAGDVRGYGFISATLYPVEWW